METMILSEQEALQDISREFLGKSGWLKSYQCRRSIDALESPLPWWSYSAIAFIRTRINKQMRVFEYGCGYSTLWMAANCANVTSVENNADWFERVKGMLPGNATVIHREGRVFAEEITRHPGPFDIVIIDGADRNRCAEFCADLPPETVIIFDNCGTRWKPGFDHLESKGWRKIVFEGIAPICTYAVRTAICYRPGNCFGI